MNEDLKKAYENMHLLNRQQRIELIRNIENLKPDFYRQISPKWRWFRPCEVNVLLVTDGGLDFGIGDFGLSEFVNTFQKLEQQSLINVKYNVTLAHRSSVSPAQMLISNPFIVNRITEFTFDKIGFNLNNFDQVWLFGILPEPSYLSVAEINKIESYMNGGGGLFATGDHGLLGAGLCSQIPRVKDMRLWADTITGEVSMTGTKRNDTNRPGVGQTVSGRFDNQSDDIPQNIAVRTFGSGLPHPLLSIPTSIRASGIIDIMPDHPHEGECTQAKVFTVTNPVTGLSQNVFSQIVATSFVLGGSTILGGGKAPTDPHCFPSISVFDGSVANVGRIAIDSTWHHFININLIGENSGNEFDILQTGFSNSNFTVIQQYYMNIATWITRRKNMLCWYRWIWINLLKNSQLIEASLNNPKQGIKDIKLSDLFSIGMLAKEIISSRITPAFAEEFMFNSIEPNLPKLAIHLNIWKPIDNPKGEIKNEFHQDWINYDLITATAVGAGFIALRDNFNIDSDKFSEKDFDKMANNFYEGTKYGIEVSTRNLLEKFDLMSKTVFINK
jgi:hypothetical protein